MIEVSPDPFCGTAGFRFFSCRFSAYSEVVATTFCWICSLRSPLPFSTAEYATTRKDELPYQLKQPVSAWISSIKALSTLLLFIHGSVLLSFPPRPQIVKPHPKTNLKWIAMRRMNDQGMSVPSSNSVLFLLFPSVPSLLSNCFSCSRSLAAAAKAASRLCRCSSSWGRIQSTLC